MSTAFRGIAPSALTAAAFGVAVWLAPVSSMAAGALAVGAPPDIVHQGFAYGIVVNVATEEEARSEALDKCRTAQNAGEPAKEACTLVRSFTHECAAASMDPANGTPGVGWAVAPTRDLAEREALDSCKTTAGESRKDYCEISGSFCDTQ